MNNSITNARNFAIKHHGSQMYGQSPYIQHMDNMLPYLEPYGDTTCIIGYLHDIIEDTDVTYHDINMAFGDFVADCVQMCTDPVGDTRKIRKRASHIKFGRCLPYLNSALIVKAVDRLSNIEECIRTNDARLEGYRKEHPSFKAAVYRPGLCYNIWDKIDELCD